MKSKKRSRDERALSRVKQHERERLEIEELNAKTLELAPARGSLYRIGEDETKVTRFEDIGISHYTLAGLKRGNFETLTEIQRYAIPHALVGRDILAAAKTGSGKTLAFLVPLLERLYRSSSWSPELGVGAIIISPTRELAVQIFEVVRVVGFKHPLTAGLLIGGTDFSKEQQSAARINIVICTPGRILQHLEQTPFFNVSDTQVLVLDEADRLLDMGFKKQLGDIIGHLPPGGVERQTMLFSATQTKSVKDLARLSLKNPEYVSVYQNSSYSTPKGLAQAYSVCKLEEKLDVLYSFIRTHLKSKTIVFLSSCQQVRFVDAAFRRLRPGISIMCLHGKIKQKRRMHIYYEFVQNPAAVMFATDVAARGLDFPAVDWVIQADCPEDVAGYIHRVGRTARYKNQGKALLLLEPSEAEAMVPLLQSARIPIVEKNVNPDKRQSIGKKLRAELARDVELKEIAQKAFKSYLRSIHLQPNKQVFDVHKLSFSGFAQSLGLSATPRVKFPGQGGENSRKELRKQKNTPRGLAKLEAMEDAVDITAALAQPKRKQRIRNQVERMLSKKSETADENKSESDEDGDEDEMLVVRKSLQPIDKDDDVDPIMFQSERARKRIRISKSGLSRGKVRGTKIVFDAETGQGKTAFEKLAVDADGGEDDADKERSEYLAQVAQRLKDQDKEDVLVERERIKEKHRKERMKQRARKNRNQSKETETRVELGNVDGFSNEDEEVEEEDMEAKALKLISLG